LEELLMVAPNMEQMKVAARRQGRWAAERGEEPYRCPYPNSALEASYREGYVERARELDPEFDS
jgi:hypothetical protein